MLLWVFLSVQEEGSGEQLASSRALSPATTAALLPTHWDSKEQGGRSEEGRAAGCVNTACLQKGCHLVEVGPGWLPSLGLSCKPGRGVMVV